jgi:hypothetical protein
MVILIMLGQSAVSVSAGMGEAYKEHGWSDAGSVILTQEERRTLLENFDPERVTSFHPKIIALYRAINENQETQRNNPAVFDQAMSEMLRDGLPHRGMTKELRYTDTVPGSMVELELNRRIRSILNPNLPHRSPYIIERPQPVYSPKILTPEERRTTLENFIVDTFTPKAMIGIRDAIRENEETQKNNPAAFDQAMAEMISNGLPNLTTSRELRKEVGNKLPYLHGIPGSLVELELNRRIHAIVSPGDTTIEA